MLIRSETLADYPAIAALNVRAFDNIHIAGLISLLRQRRAFRSDFSLVAEQDGRIIGHVLFTLTQVYVLDQLINVVVLSPLAVEPAFQRQGIGEALVQEGHRFAREQGAECSILVGHPDYYPRFGYIQQVHGRASVTVTPDQVPSDALGVSSRVLQENDIPALQQLWLAEEQHVDLNMLPEPTLIDWLSPNPQVQVRVYTRDAQIVGYTRIKPLMPLHVDVFLAADDRAAQGMLHLLATAYLSSEPYTLPIHPLSRTGASRVFGESQTQAWTAGMLCPLRADSMIHQWLAQRHADRRSPSRIIWWTAYDLT